MQRRKLPSDKRRTLTPDEIRAEVERMRRDPKIRELVRKGEADAANGEGARWADVKRHDGRH